MKITFNGLAKLSEHSLRVKVIQGRKKVILGFLTVVGVSAIIWLKGIKSHMVSGEVRTLKYFRVLAPYGDNVYTRWLIYYTFQPGVHKFLSEEINGSERADDIKSKQYEARLGNNLIQQLDRSV